MLSIITRFISKIHVLKISFIFLALMLYVTPSSANYQMQAVDRAMDCVEQNMTQEGEISWNDVCYWTDSYPQPDASYSKPAPKRMSKVNKALDDREAVEQRHSVLFQEGGDHSIEKVLDKKRSKDKKLLNEYYARENVKNNRLKKHTVSAAYEFFGVHYDEPDVMEQGGPMHGISGEYTYRPEQGDFLHTNALNLFRFEALFASGKFDYKARGSQTGLRTFNDKNHMFELRGIFGKEYAHEGFDFLAYSGFGHRYLFDKDGGPTEFNGTTFYGYDRESRYFYIPIGVDYVTQIDPGWSMTLNAEFDWFLWGKQVSEFSDIDQYLPDLINEDISNQQNSGYGIRASAKFLKALDQVNVFVEPFIRYWRIEDSEIKSTVVFSTTFTGLEPENSTLEGGFKLGLQY